MKESHAYASHADKSAPGRTSRYAQKTMNFFSVPWIAFHFSFRPPHSHRISDKNINSIAA